MYNLFGSKTRIDLITKLVMNPDRTYYIRELAKETDIPYGMVYRELENLEELGIITRIKRGNLIFLQVNKKLPYIYDLRNIIMKTTGMLQTLKDALGEMAHIKYMLVFGSIAEGTDDITSDIDLLIIGDADETSILKAINSIEHDTGREVNYILWAIDEFEEKVKENNHLLIDISMKPITMLWGNEDEFRGLVEGSSHQTYNPKHKNN